MLLVNTQVFSLYTVISNVPSILFFMQETCEKNKANQAKVKFHQTTGSHSYMVHCENLVSHTFFFYTIQFFLVHYYDVTSCILIVFRERSTMIKISMLWIC
jgi:hypothetical protein